MAAGATTTTTTTMMKIIMILTIILTVVVETITSKEESSIITFPTSFTGFDIRKKFNPDDVKISSFREVFRHLFIFFVTFLFFFCKSKNEIVLFFF